MEADTTVVRKKKEISSIRRERRKITRNLEGVRKMSRLPGAVVVADIRRDEIAVNEARSLGIPVIGLVDTDCDPRIVDLVIPGNDDAYRSIEVVLATLANAILTGRDKLVARQAEEEKKRQEEEAEARRKAQERTAAAQEAKTEVEKPQQKSGSEQVSSAKSEPPAESAAGATSDS